MRQLTKKAVSVGNFRMYLTSVSCGAKERIEAVKVTNLDSTWSVTIPMTFGVFKIILELWSSEKDEDVSVLNTLFCNWYTVTCIADGEFHMDIIKAADRFISRVPKEEEGEGDVKRMEMAETSRDILAE